MQLPIHPVHGQGAERPRLLALPGLRRGLEPGAPDDAYIRSVAAMTDPTSMAGRVRIIAELHELIAALDRRVPQVERVGEISIARAAEGLRGEALKRIEELERQGEIRDAPTSPLQS